MLGGLAGNAAVPGGRRRGMKIIRLAFDPGEKVDHGGFVLQQVDRVKPTGEFRLGKAGVYGAVADLMKPHGFQAGTTF